MASTRKANEAQFYFFVKGVKAETFEVMNFSGADELSTAYRFTIMLLSNEIVEPETVINKGATLYIHREGEYYPYSGIVSDIKYVDRGTNRITYAVTLVPRLWLLKLNRQNRIFQHMKVDAVIKKILDDAGMSGYYTISLNGSYPEREYVVQYQESDFHFISRLMEENGIWYQFQENPILADELNGEAGTESLVITDDASQFTFVDTSSDILYRSESGMNERIDEEAKEHISRIQCEGRILPKEAMVKNYNYRTPEVDLSGKKPVTDGSAGTVYEYGGSFKDASAATAAATRLAQRIASRRTSLDGSGTCRGFRAGKRFTLQEHSRDDLNDTFVIVRVAHQGAHNSAGEGVSVFSYGNSFSCIPADKADQYKPPVKTMAPKVNGILTAAIETNSSDYAALDDMGRYKVRLPFDVSGAKNYEGSKYVRLAQPYAGANYGIHFPSHEGAEMVIACVNGDPDKPMGIGTVPNANTVSPVVSGNQQENLVRTAGGNELLMLDTDGEQKVRMITKTRHTLEMDDKEKRLFVQTTDGNQLLMDDKNKKCSWNADKHNITMDYDKKKITITSGGGHVINIDDQGKKITIQSKAGNVMEMDDNGGKITMTDSKSKNTVTLDGASGLTLKSTGKIVIDATQDLEIKAMNVKVSANQAIEQKATTDFKVSGLSVDMKGTTGVKMKGLNVEIKGDIGAKVEGGVTFEAKGGVQAKVSGTMAEVGGTVMTTVKGGIVMVN